ncbi:unnamed protein product [Brachionus calyciflorus]|uniref:Apple domain-containing protein n=1 Tax=Brachionus calyciflorus TaxID=104777 RepID=A0A813RN17_9BILA|nr:unnamed protein product [Brachionus calyciflorus]
MFLKIFTILLGFNFWAYSVEANILEHKFDLYIDKGIYWSSSHIWSQNRILTYNGDIDCLIQCNKIKTCLSLMAKINPNRSVLCIFYYLPHNLTNFLDYVRDSIVYNKKVNYNSVFTATHFTLPPTEVIYWTRQSKYYIVKYTIEDLSIWIKLTNHSISDKYFRNSTTSYLGEELNTSFNDCESLCMNNTECFHFTLINETTENENKTKCILSRFTPNQNIKNISLCPANAICNSLISSNEPFRQVQRYVRNDVTTRFKTYIAFFDDITGIWTNWILP